MFWQKEINQIHLFRRCTIHPELPAAHHVVISGDPYVGEDLTGYYTILRSLRG